MKMDKLFFYLALIPLSCSLFGQLSWFDLYWPTIFQQFQLQALVTALLLLIISGLLRSRKIAITSAALLISALIAIAPALTFKTISVPQGEGVKVINFNAFSHSNNQKATANLLRTEQPDVVALIEANELWREMGNSLMDVLPNQYLIDHPYHHGLLLLSRYPILATAEIATSLESIKMLQADIELPSGPARFVLVHTMPPLQAKFLKALNLQVRGLNEIVTESPYPIVLLGDYNSVPWAPVIANLSHSSQLMGANLRASWPNGLHSFGLAIDHILAGKGAFIKDTRMLPWINGSDHRGMISTLVFAKAHP